MAGVTNPRTVEGPVGLVGAGYIGHLFAQHFALAGYEVRAWSPGRSAGTLHERLRQSLAALAEVGAVQRTAVDGVMTRVSTHDELAQALAPCAAVMESIVEDAEVKASCYRGIEAAIGPDVLLWSSTSNFPMTRLAAGMDHPERAIVVHPVQTQLIIFVEVVAGDGRATRRSHPRWAFAATLAFERFVCARRFRASFGTGCGLPCCARCFISSTSALPIPSSSTRSCRPRCGPSSPRSVHCR